MALWENPKGPGQLWTSWKTGRQALSSQVASLSIELGAGTPPSLPPDTSVSPSIQHGCLHDPLAEICLQSYLSQLWGPWTGAEGPKGAGLGLHSL